MGLFLMSKTKKNIKKFPKVFSGLGADQPDKNEDFSQMMNEFLDKTDWDTVEKSEYEESFELKKSYLKNKSSKINLYVKFCLL